MTRRRRRLLLPGVVVLLLTGCGLSIPTDPDGTLDRIVALPVLRGRRLDGIPSDAEGFTPVDDTGIVHGFQDVYAIGDVTDRPVKQGGLACQQADVTAAHLAARAGADVVVAGEEQVDLRAGLAALHERGLRRIGCEGGPKLFGSLIEEDLVDELCLTLSPLLTNGDASRIASGSGAELQLRMQLRAALHADSMLLLRYERQR